MSEVWTLSRLDKVKIAGKLSDMNDPLEGLSRDELRQLALESMIRLEKAGRIDDVIKIINKTQAKPSTQADKEELLAVAMRLDKR